MQRTNLTKKDLINSIYMQIGFSKNISDFYIFILLILFLVRAIFIFRKERKSQDFNDIKKIKEDHEHLFEFFIEAVKYFNFESDKINPLYLKYIELCEIHYLPLPNFENDSDDENKYNKVSSE